jgi:hypothetical protein
MKKSQAEATYKMKLDKAKAYQDSQQMPSKDGRIASGGAAELSDEKQIAILEIWDKLDTKESFWSAD